MSKKDGKQRFGLAAICLPVLLTVSIPSACAQAATHHVVPNQAVQDTPVYTLETCRNMALEHNKALKSANEQVQAAKHLEKAAKTQYLPRASAIGMFLYNQKRSSLMGEDAYLPVYTMGADGAPSFFQSVNNQWQYLNGMLVAPLDANGQPFNPSTNPEKIQWKQMAYLPKDAFTFDLKQVYVGNILITQPLFLGGKILAMNELAKGKRRLADAGLEGQRTQTLLETDIAYWRIVSLVNKEKLALKYLELLNRMAADVERSVAIGVATRADLLTVKVKQNEAEMALLQVRDGLMLSRMALNQRCGLPLDAPFRLVEESLDLVDMPGAEPLINQIDTEGAIDRRSEIKTLEAGLEMAEANKKLMVSRFLPNAALTAGYLTTNPSFFNGVSNTFDGQFQVGVVVNVPLFHWGERVQTLRSARHEKQALAYQLEEAREKIALDVTQSRFKFDAAAKKVVMTASNKEKAHENLGSAQLGFDAGVIPTSSVLEAQTAWLKACSDHIDAQIDCQLNLVYLQKALGQLTASNVTTNKQ